MANSLRRTLPGTLLSLCVGCGMAPANRGGEGAGVAVTTAPSVRPLGEPSAAQTSVAASFAPSPASEDDAVGDLLRWATLLDGEQQRAAQRELRTAIVGADRRATVLASQLLVQHYVSREAFGDAFAVVEAGLAQSSGAPELEHAHGLLLRDTGQFDLARAALRRALAANPAEHIATLTLAELEVAGGDATAARARLIEMLGRHGADPWVDEHRSRISALAEHARLVAAGEATPQVGLALELGILRGSTDPARRRIALERLLGQPSHRPAALRAALSGSAGTTIRILGLRSLSPADGATDACEVLLEHADPLVRGAAARAAARCGVATELLLARLDAEEDGYAFRSLHDALTERLGAQVGLRSRGEDDPDRRRATRTAWRQKWNP